MRDGKPSTSHRSPAVTILRSVLLVASAPVLAGCTASKDPATVRQEEVSTDPTAMMRIGEAAEASQDWASAETFYKRASSLDPNLATASLAHARVVARQGDLETALTELRDAHRRYDRDPAIAGALGRMLIAVKRPTEALVAFEDSLRVTPNSAPMLVGRGVALDLLDRHAEAQQAYEAALRADPDYAAARKNLALSRARAQGNLSLDGEDGHPAAR